MDERPLSYWVGQNGRATEFLSRTCLLPMVGRFSVEMLEIWPHWDRGVMPFPGSLYEQPQIVRDAMNFIPAARANLKRD